MRFSHQLQQIMSHFALGTTEMADRISVPKATISHLISERNKPSLEFIMKLHTAFPTLNLEWLIYGKEPFLQATGKIPPSVNPLSIFETPPVTEPEQRILEPKPLEDLKENIVENVSDIEEKILSSPITEPVKKIESIVVFYSDGSFKRYTQE